MTCIAQSVACSQPRDPETTQRVGWRLRLSQKPRCVQIAKNSDRVGCLRITLKPLDRSKYDLIPELMERKAELAGGQPNEVRPDVISDLCFVDVECMSTSFVGRADMG